MVNPMTRSALLVLLSLLVPLQAQEPTSQPSSAPTSRVSLEDLPEPEKIFPGEPETFEMKPGEVKVFRYTTGVDGEASIWARSSTLDVTLEVRGPTGKRLTFDDDSGGGKSAHRWLPIRERVEGTIIVRAKPAERRGTVEVLVAVVEARSAAKDVELAEHIHKTITAMKRTREGGDLPAARRDGLRLLAEIEESGLGSRRVHDALNLLGYALNAAGSPQGAHRSWSRVRQFREKALPPEHPEVQLSRMCCASALYALGDFEGAKAQYEQVLRVREDTLSPEHPGLQKIRIDTATTHYALGELDRAKALFGQALRSREKTLPHDHADLQAIRMDYASTLYQLEDFEGARGYFEQVLRVREKTLPHEHRDLQKTRVNYASTLTRLGDAERAGRLLHQALEAREKTLPPEHPDLQQTRMQYAGALFARSDLEGAKRLQEQALRVLEKTLPPEHLELQRTRGTYATTLFALGDLAAAKGIREQVLRVFEKTLPPEHDDLQTARMNYGTTLQEIGDLGRAKEILAQVLRVYERTLSPEDPDLHGARMNYASVLAQTGEVEEATVILARVLKEWEKATPPDHPRLQWIRMNYANTREQLGHVAGANRILEQVLRSRERTLSPAHPALQRARVAYARSLFRLAASEAGARVKLNDHIRKFLAQTLEIARSWRDSLSARQVGLDTSTRRTVLDWSFSCPVGDVDENAPMSLELVEALRGTDLRSQRLRAVAGTAAGPIRELLEETRRELAIAQAALESFIANPELAARADEAAASRMARLVRNREEKERRLSDVLRTLPNAAVFLENPSLTDLASALPAGANAVSFWSYERRAFSDLEDASSGWQKAHHLVALVLTKTGDVRRVELGPSADVMRAVTMWRDLIGSSVRRRTSAGRGIDVETNDAATIDASAGERLRRLIFDPVLAALDDGTNRLVVTLSDDLHLLTLDSLPLDDGRRVGDDYSVEVVPGLEWMARESRFEPNARRLVALGDVDYMGKASDSSEAEEATLSDVRSGGGGGLPLWQRDLTQLPYTGVEVRAIATIFGRAFDDGDDEEATYEEPILLCGRRADTRRFRTLAPTARYLHLATHGWFAPDAVPSILDRSEDDARIGIRADSFRDEVRGYSPLSLCGLALTGANLPPDDDGMHPGLLSGTDIAEMDLSGVELAVLSACETNVGSKRPGQGIASLQEALFMAGVQYSVTSLWKVPDEATQKLMTRFYEGIWGRGETKRAALWNAKLKLRRTKDPRTGKPKYGLKDWAGWVLVGNPE